MDQISAQNSQDSWGPVIGVSERVAQDKWKMLERRFQGIDLDVWSKVTKGLWLQGWKISVDFLVVVSGKGDARVWLGRSPQGLRTLTSLTANRADLKSWSLGPGLGVLRLITFLFLKHPGFAQPGPAGRPSPYTSPARWLIPRGTWGQSSKSLITWAGNHPKGRQEGEEYVVSETITENAVTAARRKTIQQWTQYNMEVACTLNSEQKKADTENTWSMFTFKQNVKVARTAVFRMYA